MLGLAHSLQSGWERVVAAVVGLTAACFAVTGQDFVVVAVAVARKDCFGSCKTAVPEGHSAGVVPATFVLKMGCKNSRVMPLAQRGLCTTFAGFVAAPVAVEEALQWHLMRQKDCSTTSLRLWLARCRS